MFLVIHLSICLLLSAAYLGLILYIHKYWKKSVSENPCSDIAENSLFLTVIICARNEEANINDCLNSILACDFPRSHFEIIVVDDHSNDGTADLVRKKEHVSLLELKKAGVPIINNSYKKAAVRYAVSKAKAKYIIQTDADCIVPKNWLACYANAFADNKNIFIGGPVLIKTDDTNLSRFESLDLIGMMGVTASGIWSRSWFMANGANLAFDKNLFINSNPHNEEFASGDDIDLINMAVEYDTNKVTYINQTDNLVFTQGNDSFFSFLKQRIRWATKNKHANSIKYLGMMGVTYLLCLSILINIVLIPFKPFVFLSLLFFQLTLKVLVDYYYLNSLCNHYQQAKLMKGFFLSNVFHILYIAIIGSLSFFITNYSWKGRLTK